MAVRDEVRDAQRALATLDAPHRRAVAPLERAPARRGQVSAEADRRVAVARCAVKAAAADVARQVSADPRVAHRVRRAIRSNR